MPIKKLTTPLRLVPRDAVPRGGAPLQEVTALDYGELRLAQRRALHRRLHESEDLGHVLRLLYRATGRYCGACGLRLQYGELRREVGRCNASQEVRLDIPGIEGAYLDCFGIAEASATLRAIVHMAQVPLYKALGRMLRHAGLTRSELEHLNDPESATYAHDALLLVRLDQFHDLAAQSGEEWAHSVMCALHDQLRLALTDADGIFHVADDELAILLGDVDPAAVRRIAERARVLVTSLHLSSATTNEQLTACIGASFADPQHGPEAVMRHARDALDDARRLGRNQIRVRDVRALH
ncbi:MAG: diguanylate cyclase [Pseudomonadota bacterium]